MDLRTLLQQAELYDQDGEWLPYDAVPLHFCYCALTQSWQKKMENAESMWDLLIPLFSESLRRPWGPGSLEAGCIIY